ncbi:hypothetical protein P6144_06475 [Sphingomonas sp. HITSZ_GF]|uniref:hypothetical protein n=1 Tax=Sphingomonas sp. HITSZ_GF TaxID=3037247 RepID=UPI00240D2082|nr:hypothetical protein [Sphingomonas sp. HITSZ_GF]MDG2533285.1 hypothetical protein [Sphingomonas sp. HITSZ_GF]
MLILATLLLAPAQAEAQAPALTPAEAMEMHRRTWSANPQCTRARDENEITVCARCEADKYRVPLVTPYTGPDTDAGRLARLFDGADGNMPCGQGAFTVRCGSVGVTATVSARGVHTVRRDLAP